MKYATVQFIVMLIFALTIKAKEIHINNYFRLISDVHKYYHTFSIIFVHPDSYYDFDTTTLLYSWSRDFSQQRVMTATITFSDLVSDYNKYQRTIARPLFVVLLDTRETMNEFVKVTKNVKPISFPVWLIMFLQRPGKPLEKYCQQPAGNMLNVDFNTLMLVLCYDHPSLFEWYAIHDNRTRMFELATWTADGSLSFRTQKNLYARRSDMFGDIVRVASVNSSPLFFSENGVIGGFLGLLLIELSRVMNFTMKVLDPIEEYGSWNEKKKVWTGVIGQLVSGKADIGVSEFSITATRLNVIDFSLPLMHTPSRIYFKQPSGIDLHWSGYFKAFSLGIWIMLVTIIITASILLSVISAKGYFSMNLIFENYVHIWGIYCQQGLSEFSNKLSMRLAIFSIYISSLIITSAYSASLISFLTLSKTKLPFSNLEGYVTDGSYKLIVMKNSAELDTVYTAKIPVFSKMRGLLEEKHFPLTSSDGFKQICERKNLAFFTTEVFKTTIYVTCEVTYIESGRMDSLAMALTKGNPYTHLMNYHLRRFQLNGVINKLKNTHFLTSNLETNFSVVSLKDIMPTLTIVAGGIVLGLFILAIEKIYYFFDIRSKKAKDQVNKSDQNIESKHQVTFLANYKSEIMKRT
ncbi:glutamate receptor 3-like [Camponotus floridanus]|uniref:glutamate receptor 3-like n=1 Tax=Camponotus floridanus TaxID=104421 RepID=UPI00097161E3|nr:glutamate receptor 3-like [Camponotus floridanus]